MELYYVMSASIAIVSLVSVSMLYYWNNELKV